MVSLAGTIAADNANELSRQGYAISQWIGFDVHEIPLYTHHADGGMALGEVAFNMRVGNPKSLNNMEANFLARKGAKGYFLWKPGSDCLARTFKSFTFKPRPLGGTERIDAEPVKGCQWCREKETTNPKPAEPVAVSDVPPVAALTAAPAPSIPAFDVLHCRSCVEVFIGDNAALERRGHEVRHRTNKASTVRKPRTPRKGSAKESST